ncbi:MAG: ABC transporter permease [Lentisphaeraceae bacterium]|nr:ABC transporter permease [Lentisphaeraceae bacterium]
MITIARFTFLKLFEPAFIFLIVFGCGLSYITSGTQSLDLSFFSEMSQGTEKGNLDMGALILIMLSNIIAIFVGSTEIPRDLNTRMITILLSKPISRTKYVMGRFLGTWALTAFLYVTWLTILGGFQFYNLPDLFQFKSFALNYLYIFSLAPISAVAVTVSTYLDDVPAMIISFLFISISFSMGSVPIIIKVFPNEFANLILLFYYLLPNFAYLFRSFEAFFQVVAFLTYSMTMSFIFLKIGTTHFKERDLI